MNSPYPEEINTGTLSQDESIVEAQRCWEEGRETSPTLFPDAESRINRLENRIKTKVLKGLVEMVEMAPKRPSATSSGQDRQSDMPLKRENSLTGGDMESTRKAPIVISLLSDSEDEASPEPGSLGHQQPTSVIPSTAPMVSDSLMAHSTTAATESVTSDGPAIPAAAPAESPVSKEPRLTEKATRTDILHPIQALWEKKTPFQSTVYYAERPRHVTRTWKFSNAILHATSGRSYLKFSKLFSPEEDTAGALIPTNYSLHHDNTAAHVCAVRNCQLLFPSWDALGSHFCKEHSGFAYNDNMDGTLSFVGEYAPLRPGWPAIVSTRFALPACVPEPAPKRAPKDSKCEIVERIPKEKLGTTKFSLVKPIRQLTTNLAVVESEAVTYMHTYMHCDEVPHVLCVLKMAKLPRYRILPKQFLTSEYNNALRPVEPVHYAIALAWLTGGEVQGQMACRKSASNPVFPKPCIAITNGLTVRERGQFGYHGCVSCIHASVIGKRQIDCDWRGFVPQARTGEPVYSAVPATTNMQSEIVEEQQLVHGNNLHERATTVVRDETPLLRDPSSSPPMLPFGELQLEPAVSVEDNSDVETLSETNEGLPPQEYRPHGEVPTRTPAAKTVQQSVVETESIEQVVGEEPVVPRPKRHRASSKRSPSLYEESSDMEYRDETPPSAARSTRPANKRRRRRDRLSSGSSEAPLPRVTRRSLRTRVSALASTTPAQNQTPPDPPPPEQPEPCEAESDWERHPGYLTGGPYNSMMAMTCHFFNGPRPFKTARDIGAHGIVIRPGEEYKFSVEKSWLRSCSVAVGTVRFNMFGQEHTLREDRTFPIRPGDTCTLKNIGPGIAKIHCHVVFNYELRSP